MRSFAQLLVLKVIYPNLLGLPDWLPLPAAIFEIAHQLLFLRIDRDHGLPVGLKGLDPLINVGELGVAIRMRTALLRFPVRLQTIVQSPQEAGDSPGADGMPHRLQFYRQAARTFAGPPQGRLRIATGHGVYQRFHVPQQRGVALCHRLASTTTTTHPAWGALCRRASLLRTHALGNRGTRETGCCRHGRNPAAPQGLGFSGCPQAAHAFIHKGTQRLKLLLNEVYVLHTSRVACGGLNGQLILAQLLSEVWYAVALYG